MDYDKDKVDEMTLALMYLVMSRDRGQDTGKAWMAFDRNTLNRLHQKGLIADPQTKGPTVGVSAEGVKMAEEMFRKYFQKGT
jgi:hypothetical protein